MINVGASVSLVLAPADAGLNPGSSTLAPLDEGTNMQERPFRATSGEGT